jgi:hypothetical protein
VGEVGGVVAAGHDHDGRRVLLHDLAGGLQAVHAGHLDVHGDDVGPQPRDQAERLGPARRLAHDLEAAVATEDPGQQPPGHLGVVDNQDPQHQIRRLMVSSSRSWSKAPLTM